MRNLTLILIITLLLTVGTWAADPIQTQPSSDGKMDVALIGCKIRNNVLTIKISIENISESRIEPELTFKDFYYTDINAQKKYYALKDSDGKYIAGPVNSGWQGGLFKTKIPPKEKRIIWVKFPGPPEQCKSIDIFCPAILPFEDIEIKH